MTERLKHTLLSRSWWRTSFRLWAYILKAHIGPFFLAFSVIMFVFLLQFLMRFIDKLVGKGIDAWTIIQLITLNLAWMVVLAMPMASLVASLMAFGSLSASNEITAMKSAGVSFVRMMFPVVLLGALLAFADLRFNNDVLPDANHAVRNLQDDIKRKKPTFSIEAGEFTDDNALPDYSIYAKDVVHGTNEMRDVTIYDHSSPQEIIVLTARTARINFSNDYKTLIMQLDSGELHEAFSLKPDEYRRGKFVKHEVRIPASGFEFIREDESSRGDRELSADDLLVYVRTRDTIAILATKTLKTRLASFAKLVTESGGFSVTADSSLRDTIKLQMLRAELRNPVHQVAESATQISLTKRDAGGYLVEIHKKYSLPAACIVFVLLGAPLGALARRGGIGMGVGLSIGFFIVYWAFLIGGEKLADRGIISPWSGMWSANIILTAVGLVLINRVMQERQGFGIRLLTKLFKRKKDEV